jgi:hypothetical protein
MKMIIQAAAVITAIGTIGGGALYLDNAHVPASEFQQYIEQQQIADEREYVLDLKAQIREVRYALIDRPDDEFLLDLLDSLEQELCEYRPNECEE